MSIAELEPQALAERLKEILRASAWYDLLFSIRELNLPDWFVAGGAIRNTVWQSLYGSSCKLKIKDIDLVFYEKGTEREREREAREKLQEMHPSWVFDVKNQSGFGIWRPWPFVFVDSSDGIAHFLHTATAAGVRIEADDSLSICQPYGLLDLFAGVIRPTPFRHDSQVAQAKQDDFLSKCPELTCQPAFVAPEY